MATPPPKRSDSYEAQLSDGQLIELHSNLLAGKEALDVIAETLPPWRSGRYMGQQPSIATLSNIRQRLILEADLQEDEATTETILESLKAEVTSITDEELDRLGARTFSLLALRRRDLDGFEKIRSARAKGELESKKLELAKQDADRKERELALQLAKFEEAKRKAALADAAEGVTKSGLSPEEKDRRIREIFGLK